MMTELYEQISELINKPTRDLDTIERTLTDGYAHALALEAEKVRLEKQIGELTQGLQPGDAAEKVNELSMLAKRIDVSISDLAELRSMLADLRRHADAVRLEAAVR